jgi:tRNA (adenine57-N1/adenine58-N1)-methyltransferase catalytic subunit
MDFTRPLLREDSVATTANIRLIDESSSTCTNGVLHQATSNSCDCENDTASQSEGQRISCVSSLDTMVIQAANQAARDLLLSGLTEDQKVDVMVDSSLYSECVTPLKENIQEGDLVVIMESFDRLSFAYADREGVYCNRNGQFHHKDFIGKPFGCKIRSSNNRGYGFCYLLKPTPELWARSLNHRTQIVHELDQSQIIFQLYLRPNMIVVESGTGSGAMSHAILRTIAPHGHLHTYEFNQVRAETAEKEFASNGAAHLVTVNHRDVCARETGKGGFDLPERSADAVFLDLPEPWWAVPHAAAILKPNARISSYSPCVEQTQKTVEALQKSGFHSIKTMEYRLREHYVDEFKCEGPPRAKRMKFEAQDHEALSNALAAANSNGKRVVQLSNAMNGNKNISSDNDIKSENGGDANSELISAGDCEKLTVARPFVMMRGHTAFLTFATAGHERLLVDGTVESRND